MTVTSRSAELAALAGLLADRTRAAFCLALMDGRAWTAGELATHAGVAPSTATEHLNRLAEGGLLVERRQGRHRYVQLADHRVAHLIEDLVSHLGRPEEESPSLRSVIASAALAHGRTCYDHLAGRLGVGITDAMSRSGLLDQVDGFSVTEAGTGWLTSTLGVGLDALRSTRRPLARACLDWTERRSHLAGTAGALLCRGFLERGWIRRAGGGRAVRLTPAGEAALREVLDLDAATLGLAQRGARSAVRPT